MDFSRVEIGQKSKPVFESRSHLCLLQLIARLRSVRTSQLQLSRIAIAAFAHRNPFSSGYSLIDELEVLDVLTLKLRDATVRNTNFHFARPLS
jgi:hypothetical protein